MVNLLLNEGGRRSGQPLEIHGSGHTPGPAIAVSLWYFSYSQLLSALNKTVASTTGIEAASSKKQCESPLRRFLAI